MGRPSVNGLMLHNQEEFMKRVIAIGGQGGSGKTAVGKALVLEIKPSAYVGADALMTVNPFEVNEALEDLGLKNALAMISNFHGAGYDLVVLAGLIRNQRVLDELVSQLPPSVQFTFIWLRASKQVRDQRRLRRSRDDADKVEWVDFVDRITPDVPSFKLFRGHQMSIDTTDKTIIEVVKEIGAS